MQVANCSNYYHIVCIIIISLQLLYICKLQCCSLS